MSNDYQVSIFGPLIEFYPRDGLFIFSEAQQAMNDAAKSDLRHSSLVE